MTNYHYHHAQLEQVRKAIRARGRVARKAQSRDRDRVEELEDEVAFLNLVNRTLIGLLVENGMTDSDDLARRIFDTDVADGELDGGSSADDLARDMGLAAMPEQAREPAKAPVPTKKRR